jgi:hypothetical protein
LSRVKADEVLDFVNQYKDQMPGLRPRTLELHPVYQDNWQTVAKREIGIRD